MHLQRQYIIGVKVDHAVHQMTPVAVKLSPAYGIHGKLNLYCYCNYSYHHGCRLLIIIFAIFVCVCVGCCRRCYCKSDNRNREIATITIESNSRSLEYIEQPSNHTKGRIDAPPSYFDITPNFTQDDDLPPPYPGENNT